MRKIWCLLLCGLAPVASLAQCLDDYHVNQKWQAHRLSPPELQTAIELAGSPGDGWRFLASRGDVYAALAADVIQPKPGGPGQALHTYIRRHWLNTVGADVMERNFLSFARQHFRQYVEVLRSGTWPDADQILNSYLTAARAHGLPELTVFDAAWTASDFSKTVSWQTLNLLPPSRQTRHSRICLTITLEEANESLRRDFSGAR